MSTIVLTQQDLIQISNKFPNINYIPSFGGTILHLMCVSGLSINDYYDKIIEAKNVGIDFYKKGLLSETPVHVECVRYDNYDMLKFLIDNNFIDINYYYTSKSSSDKKNCFLLACSRGNERIIKILLDNNVIHSYTDLDHITNINLKSNICQYIIENMLKVHHNKTDFHSLLNLQSNDYLKEHDNFREFNFDEFNILVKIGEGTYGAVNIARNVSTGEICVIKKFEKFGYSDDENEILPDSTIRDISCLKILQSIEHTCNIFGIIQHNDEKYMILEFLKYTVSDVLKILHKCNYNKEKYNSVLMWLLQGIIECIDMTSKCCICHFDVKGANIMMSMDNKIKLIDFGISIYLGICPLKSVVNQDIYKNVYMAHDGTNNTKVIREVNRNSGKYKETKNTITYKCNNISYQRDMVSIGLMILASLGFGYLPYFVYNGEIYKSQTDERNIVTDYYSNVSDDDKNIINNKLTPLTKRIVYDMLEIETEKRKTAIEILSEYFYHKPLIHPNLELTDVNFDEKSNILSEQILSQFSTVSSNNYNSRGFLYYDDNIDFFAKKKLPAIADAFDIDFYNMIIHVYQYMINKKCHGDAILNYIIFMKENRHIFNGFDNMQKMQQSRIKNQNKDSRVSVDNIENLQNNDMQSSTIACMFYNDFFNQTLLKMDKIIEIQTDKNLKKRSDYKKLLIKKYENETYDFAVICYSNLNIYNIRPIFLFINYIKFLLQAVCLDENRIKNLIINTTRNVIFYIIFIHCTVDLSISCFDLVKTCYNMCENSINLNFETNVEVIELINERMGIISEQKPEYLNIV